MRLGMRYYCPPGVPKPAHRPDLSPAACVDGKGPDAAIGAGPGGGMVYGGAYTDGEPGWQPTSAGWWLNVGDALPQILVRVDTPREIARWTDIPGALDGHYWRVPVLLTRRRAGGEVGMTFGSALERTWRGPDAGWADAPALKPLQDDLLKVAYGVALTGEVATENAALTDVAVRLLGVGHLVGPVELGLTGWLTERVMLLALNAAVDINPATGEAA